MMTGTKLKFNFISALENEPTTSHLRRQRVSQFNLLDRQFY